MALIPDEIIQQVAAANDIVEVIGTYFPLKRAGPTYKALCPFHQERTPSFSVNPARQIFKCFGCGAGGSMFRFVMDYEHIEFTAAVRKLADRVGIRIEREELSLEDRQRLDLRRRLLSLHAEAAQFFHLQLLRSPAAQVARDYLKGRGINAEIAKSWTLGYAPEGWDHFLRWAHSRHYSQEEIAASGLVSFKDPENQRGECYDRFRGRVMFPICNDNSEVIAFSGRILQPDAKGAKYVNSPETMLFTKGAVLFGLHRSKRALIDKKSAIVCEGQLDLITAFEAGIQNVIAPQGTAFTPKQARILKRYVEEVILCFDSDAAGEKAAERSLPSLLAEKLAVRVATLPQGEDPDSLIRGKGPDAFRAQMDAAREFFDVQIDRLAAQSGFDSARGRSEAAQKVAESLGFISDSVLREMHIQRLATRLELAPQALATLSAQAATRHRNQGERREGNDGGDQEAQPTQPIKAEPTVGLLALVLMHSPEARQWLLEEDWESRLQAEPQGHLIEVLLQRAHLLDMPETLHTFLSGLEPALERFFVELLENNAPEHPLAVSQDCWNELERRQLRRRIESTKARQRNPSLTLEEAGALHQQILDLQKRVSDITRPFSPLR
ncbi:MAG: DNA primase [Verrucomicrobia bacterium]|nr:MAG: DNA primase [Verrucomicrobiota bacterium]